MQKVLKGTATVRRLVNALGVFVFIGLLRVPAQADSVVLFRTTAANVPMLVIKVDLNNPNVKVTGVIAEGGCGRSETLDRMVSRTHPTAAVTGTYFDIGALAPVGDIVIDGHLAHRGSVGTGLCINSDNECSFVQPPHSYTRMDWSDYDFVCCSGPRLVHNGRAGVNFWGEGFHDKHLLQRNSRLAVGMTKNKKLIFVATRQRVQLGQLAKALKKLGCVEAMNLDAGSSLGFYHRGHMIIRPQRRLTNAILIYDDPARYEKFKARLAPHRAPAKPRIIAKR